MNIKKILTTGRVIILMICLVLSILAINPQFWNTGAAIRSVELNSSASIAGIASPSPTSTPLSRERIVLVDNIPIKNANDYYNSIQSVEENQTVQIKTDKGFYSLIAKEKSNKTDLGLSVFDAPTTNIRKGLDLQGGTRIMLQPEEKLSNDDMSILISNMNERLNVFGLTDVTTTPVSDLQGNKYILVEVAGANDQEVIDLISKQGKFEAKIGNASVFKGGQDITYVCRSADCSGISPYQAPQQISDKQWSSTFQFSITLSTFAAEKMANATKNLEVQGEYLSLPISLYLDDSLVDELKIGSTLKGKVVTDVAISGPGVGATMQDSQYAALQAMKKLQTILITGSLPVKLDIVKVDTISPVLGSNFIGSAFKMALFAILAVALVIFIRYRKPQVAIPIMLTGLSEVIIILGVAALIGWNIDIASIAGILVAIGTGVDSQIVIVDESTTKRNVETNWLKRMKNAFFIIFASYFVGVASMVPLLFLGAGLLKGFALTSILGISVGVFITRPAFAAVVENLLKEE